MRPFTFTVICALLLAAAEASHATDMGLELPGTRATCFERYEITLTGMPETDAPFDPDVIALDLEVSSPSKKYVVPGFYTRQFERKLDGNREVLTPGKEGEWRIRWLPLEPGKHTLTAVVKLAGNVAIRNEETVDVAPPKRHGLVKVESKLKRNFCFDDGTPLFLNGLCACWHGSRGTFDYDDWLPAYQKNGINYMRLWMWHQAFGIEWDRNDKLRYRMDNAWRLDRVMEQAEERGVYVMLCLDYHGIFEVKPDFWGGNNFWTRNPYNITNGGPCKTQNDFFTSDEAKKLYQKRLRYIVARWSAYPNLLAWEFFNEIDNEYAYLKHTDVVAWHGEMGRKLRALDAAKHLISSSFTGGSERPDLYALPEIDFAQYHSYNENNPTKMVPEKTARFLQKYNKPFFVSEYGTDWRGWKPEADPYFHALHQAIWNAPFCGSAGTSMTWWWEHIHSENLYAHWSALSAFLSGTSIGRPELQLAKFENASETILPYGLASKNEALVWLLDRAYDWPAGAKIAEPAPSSDVKLTLTGIDDGRWSVEWWDTLAGKQIATSEATAKNGCLELRPPPFRADVAAKMKRR